MRADDETINGSSAAANSPGSVQPPVASTVAQPSIDQAIPLDTQSAESVAVADEQLKTCCICGLDVTHKKRSRDSSGEYWCLHCHTFIPPAGKNDVITPCPDCGRDTKANQWVEQAGVKVCKPCNAIYLAEAEPRRLHKAAVTADPEIAIRRLIGKLVTGVIALAGVAVLLTLYHFRLLYVRPAAWVPFVGGLYTLGGLSIPVCIAIGIQYIRIAWRKRMRQAKYDQMIRTAANQILAIDDESHSLGISESPEPLRRRIDRAIQRVEACAGQGSSDAGSILVKLAENGHPEHLIRFLIARRPDTADTIARNREIATISYLHNDLNTADAAVTAIILRIHHDQEAMTRKALICYRIGELEKAKKIFKRVIAKAKEDKNEVDLAEAYCNLGMLHLMLSEFDDADVRYSQAKVIYDRLSMEAGQADCLVSLGLIAFRQKKGAQVEGNFRKALAINKRRKRKEGLSICCSLLGVILVEKIPPELGAAERLLKRSLQLNLDLGRPGGVAAAYGNLGLVRAKRNDFAGARELFLKAQGIYQRINRPKMMMKIQAMLKTVGEMSVAAAK